MTQTVLAYIRLTHPWAVVVVMAATAVFGLIASDGNPSPARFTLLLTGMLGGQIAIGATNEWADRHADGRDKPWRPIPAGLVSPAGALRFAGLGLGVMVVSGALLGVVELFLLATGTGAGLLYNLWLKRTPLSWLPYLVALPLLPVWVWLVMDGFEPALLWLYPLGAAFVLAIHLSQTLPDITADSRRGEHGTAVILGPRWSMRLIWLAGFGSVMVVSAGSRAAGGSVLPVVVVPGVVVVILALSLVAMKLWPERVQPHLFKILTTCAVILATGWILTVAG